MGTRPLVHDSLPREKGLKFIGHVFSPFSFKLCFNKFTEILKHMLAHQISISKKKSVKSSINVTTYLAPDFEATGAGPQTSECTRKKKHI